jgi:hypothetical protein
MMTWNAKDTREEANYQRIKFQEEKLWEDSNRVFVPQNQREFNKKSYLKQREVYRKKSTKMHKLLGSLKKCVVARGL